HRHSSGFRFGSGFEYRLLGSLPVPAETAGRDDAPCKNRALGLKGTSFGNSLLNNGSAYPRPTPMSPIFTAGRDDAPCKNRAHGRWTRVCTAVIQQTVAERRSLY